MFVRTYRVVVLLIVVLTALSAAGCGSAQTAAPGNGTPVPSSPASTPATDHSTEPPTTVSSEPPTTAPTDTTVQASTTDTTEGETEANWTLELSDTQTTKVNGYDLTCTLSIMALKLGGADELGTYRGVVTFEYEYDMKKGSVAGNAKGAGQEVDAVIEIVKYDREKYDAGDPLSELSGPDAMAIGTLILTGSGTANEQAGGASWSTSDSKTVQVPYKLTVDGGQVRMQLTTVAPAATFTGMITGTPI